MNRGSGGKKWVLDHDIQLLGRVWCDSCHVERPDRKPIPIPNVAGRHGCSGNPLAIHAAQRAQTSWAAHHVRVSASIHLWTRCCALMADTSRDLMIFQAWPTRNNKHPAFVVLSLSRLWQGRSLGNPHSERTASIAAACTRAARSIRSKWLCWKCK